MINGTIRPRLQDVTVNPVRLASGRCAYVVHVPQGYTAHQASDKKYYKRSNTQVTAMEDYEKREYWLDVDLINKGQVRAQHLKLILTIPKSYSKTFYPIPMRAIRMDSGLFGDNWTEYIFQSTEHVVFPHDELRLRDLGYRPIIMMNTTQFSSNDGNAVFIYWKVYADDMPPTTGHQRLLDLFNIPDSYGAQIAKVLGGNKSTQNP